MRDSHRIGFCRVAVAQRVRERGIRCMDKGYSHIFFFQVVTCLPAAASAASSAAARISNIEKSTTAGIDTGI